MKRTIVLVALVAMSLSVIFHPAITCSQESTKRWEVYFSPKGGCTEAIIRELGKAKASVLVQAYLFTSAEIGKALLDAHKRGVKVQVILDKSQRNTKYPPAAFFANAGIPTRIDAAHAIAHNKIMVIDGETVITGSLKVKRGS